MIWPLDKDFAFTIIDDTDNSTLQNISLVYNYLASKNIKTTKTIWVYPSRNKYTGQTIQDEQYFKFLLNIKKQGFEIQLHNVGSGNFKRDEILKGFRIFKEKFGKYPTMQINHSTNQDNLYWGYKRFGNVLSILVKVLKYKTRRFYGDETGSAFFWGDLSKEHIKFIRNRVFNGINTLKYDHQMPFKERKKKYCNYWFSSSDGQNIEVFNNLISKPNIEKLKREKGLCIVYTHFASGFVDETGKLNEEFKENIEYLSKQNGWFVPATEILEYLLSKKNNNHVTKPYINKLDLIWVVNRVLKKIKYGRLPFIKK